MFDFHATLTKTYNKASHFHSELEILFVIDGNITATVNFQEYELNKENVLLINPNTPHSTKSSEDSIIYTLQLSTQFMNQVSPDKNILFDTQKIYFDIHANRIQNNLKQILRDLVFQHVKAPAKTKCIEKSLVYQLLDCLIENYEMDCREIDYKNCSSDERIHYILDYINRNYMDKISLADLAEKLYISPSALSRMFKKQTNTYFVDYINQLRAKHAAQKIIHSTENITKIAMDCGFSNLSLFNKVFRKVYTTSPSEYRKNAVPKNPRETEDALNKSVQEQLRKNVLQAVQEDSNSSTSFSTEADVSRSADYTKNWCKAINIGAVSKLSRANLQFHTLYLMEHLNIEYIRIWNIFSKKLQISDGSQKNKFNYDEIDQIFDFLVSNHAKLILDFGRRPDKAFKSEGTVLFEEEEYIEFQTKDAWENLFEDFINHLLKRYGSSKLNDWIFEFSYIEKHAFPYYKDSNYDFFQVYKYGYSIIKNLLPDAEIGGFNGDIQNEYEYLMSLLTKCKDKKCCPDFLSFILFPYYTDPNNVQRRSNDSDFEINSVKLMRKLMQLVEMNDTKLYIMEWNCSIINRNLLNDSMYRATYILKIISEIWNNVDLLCLWIGSDWISNYYDSVGLSYGGSGILTKDTICKPAYFALSFLNQLGNSLIQKDAHTIITQQNNEYFILCFYHPTYCSNYFFKSEDKITFSDLKHIFTADKNLQLEIKLKNLLSNGTYVVKKHSMNEKQGNLLAEWKNFQFDTDLDCSDVKYIRNACYPRTNMKKIEIEKHEIHLCVELEPQEMILLHIFSK